MPAGYAKELRSVKQELKDVEQQLESLLSHQSRLFGRRKELEALLQQHAAQKQQQADTEWERKGKTGDDKGYSSILLESSHKPKKNIYIYTHRTMKISHRNNYSVNEAKKNFAKSLQELKFSPLTCAKHFKSGANYWITLN